MNIDEAKEIAAGVTLTIGELLEMTSLAGSCRVCHRRLDRALMAAKVLAARVEELEAEIERRG